MSTSNPGIVLEKARDESHVTISLLLTRRCNFECAHCFYECSTKFRGYMGFDVLSAVEEQALRLRELDIYPEINLVGGEPTLNMEAFGAILHEVMSWNFPVTMTTNGWWLHREKTARQFFNTVAPYVPVDGAGHGMEELCIRISDDKFHDEFRPHWLQNGKLSHRLNGVWEWDNEILYEQVLMCPVCHDEFKNPPKDDLCPDCGEYLEYEYYEALDHHLPQPHPDDPWIYVEHRSMNRPVAPLGRAKYFGWAEIGCDKYSQAKELSYLPNGKLMDICCKGAWCEFGTVWDDPLLLLTISDTFVRERKPRCYFCREEAEDWKKTRLRKVRAEVRKQLNELQG